MRKLGRSVGLVGAALFMVTQATTVVAQDASSTSAEICLSVGAKSSRVRTVVSYQDLSPSARPRSLPRK